MGWLSRLDGIEIGTAGTVDQDPEHSATEIDVPELEAGFGDRGLDQVCVTFCRDPSSPPAVKDRKEKRGHHAHAREQHGCAATRRTIHSV